MKLMQRGNNLGQTRDLPIVSATVALTDLPPVRVSLDRRPEGPGA